MDYKAEYGVIGSIMLDPGCLDGIRGILTPEDFTTAQGKAVYETVCRLQDEGRGIDPIIVLGETDVEERWLMDVMDITPTAVYALDYAEQMRKERQLRSLRNFFSDLSVQASAQDADPARLIGEAQEYLSGTGSDTWTISPEEALTRFYEHLRALRNGHLITVTTGFPSIDSILGGGMIKTGLYIIAARPGVGKTSLGLITAELASKSHRVLFVSLEMSETEIMARRHANLTGIRVGRLLHDPGLSDDEYAKISSSSYEQAQRGLTLSTKTTATVAEIGVMARSCKAELVIIDYLGLIQSDGDSAYERVTRISGSLKRLARSLGCPVLCLAQLNRQSENRADKRPGMSDLRDSGAIEQDADGILLLHRPALYWEEPPKQNDSQPFDVEIAKNRHGPTGRVSLTWYANNGRFIDGDMRSWL